MTAATTTPAIRIRHVSHRFGAKQVLHDVNFHVMPGEIFGFIGPNGAGKTTTIRIMATLLHPQTGRVEINGVDVTMEPEAVRRTIGYMADHAGVYDRVTVREYLEFFTDAYRVKSPNVVGTVLELTDIGPLQNQMVATLSKGQKQRLQLARILVHDPSVLILDEPASDLDPRARIEIRDLLLDLKSLGKTILLSSHILSELSDVCTSIGILEQGKMVVSGTLDEVAARYAQSAPAAANVAGALHTPGPTDGYVAPPQTLKLRVMGDPATAVQHLTGAPNLESVSLSGGVIQVAFRGGDDTVAKVVSHLVYRDIAVVAIERERNELERIFLEATRQGGQR